MDIIFLIPIALFICIILFAVMIFFSLKSLTERRKLMEKIQYEGDSVGSKSVTYNHYTSGLQKQFGQYFLNISNIFGNIAKPKNEEDISKIQKSLSNIGYRNSNASIIYFGSKALCTFLMPTIGFLLFKVFVSKPLGSFFPIVIIVFLALIGSYLPSIWLRIKAANRKEKILESFPDALDLLVVCVEAGMGLDAALDRVGEEMKISNKIISEELKLFNKEMKIGKTRRDALKNLARRTGVEDVNNLVTLLVQTDKFGTSIGQALRIHSDFMRVQRRQRAEEKAVKLPLKLLFPLIFFIFPSLFVVILGPALTQVYRMFYCH